MKVTSIALVTLLCLGSAMAGKKGKKGSDVSDISLDRTDSGSGSDSGSGFDRVDFTNHGSKKSKSKSKKDPKSDPGSKKSGTGSKLGWAAFSSSTSNQVAAVAVVGAAGVVVGIAALAIRRRRMADGFEQLPNVYEAGGEYSETEQAVLDERTPLVESV
mmetsp:Transcript_29234/g.76582  ORF Transcript_29234/g.76582 Transcript_29234/m.76582 type:complete len:159 (-) Transcript_29234:312-788(-)|eukprot:CAMPEP_0182924458 /NCGR_PEP_ID=MMETSP0105_2-20130417/6053_1 /TAXON_ID=81532 ORGANISM="Acanthoeca-like sp., Strain 10tr" /NCGR_SAMPLE_ID=MMETSP0105_2 /ASSEMBLY_ACC=CAM_ASM_000205 /LENGTH=158 /DNA_ID=CAMNT_0025062233 /DNA_START=81 /DNA_END=557 /DNA_ORIENTATION=+